MSQSGNKGISDDIIQGYNEGLRKNRLTRKHIFAALNADKEAGGEEESLSMNSLTFIQQNLLNNISKLKQQLSQEMTQLETKFLEQFRQYQEIKQVIDKERKQLERIYDISLDQDDVNGIVQLRQEKRFELDAELETKRKQFEEMMVSTKREWGIERETYQLRRKEAEEDLKLLMNELEKKHELKKREHEDRLRVLTEEINRKEREVNAKHSVKERELDDLLKEKQHELDKIKEEKQEFLSHYDKELIDQKSIIEKEKEALRLNWDLAKSEEELRHKERLDQLRHDHMKEKDMLQEELHVMGTRLEEELSKKKEALDEQVKHKEAFRLDIEEERKIYMEELAALKKAEQEKFEQEKKELGEKLRIAREEADEEVKKKRQRLVDKEMQLANREQELNQKDSELATLRFRLKQLEEDSESIVTEALRQSEDKLREEHQSKLRTLKSEFLKKSRVKEEIVSIQKSKLKKYEDEVAYLKLKLNSTERKVEQLVSKAVHRLVPNSSQKSRQKQEKQRKPSPGLPKIVRSIK